MKDLFDDFDLLCNELLGFGAPTRIKFNTRGTKDLSPVKLEKWENYPNSSDEKEGDTNKFGVIGHGYRAICRTVGINPEDVKVEITKTGISVDGETKEDNAVYNQHVELPIAKSILNDIKGIRYFSKNGLTYIYIILKDYSNNVIDVQRLEELPIYKEDEDNQD